MIKAENLDKSLVIDILASSFDTNKSVNYVVKQDRNRKERIRRLMEYSFDVCMEFGEVYLSDDKKGCALVLLPEKKRTTIRSILWDAKLAFSSIGIDRIARVLEREKQIKSHHPKSPLLYLWFMGVNPEDQHKGIGTNLLNEVIRESVASERPIYLETSTMTNIPWYQKFGFEILKELDLTYKLYIMNRKV